MEFATSVTVGSTPTSRAPSTSAWSPATGRASTGRSVRGINLITLLWTDGDRKIPVDYRLFSKADGKTKHDHFWEMLLMAKGRGLLPEVRPVRRLVRQPRRTSSRSATSAGTG